MPRRGNVPKRKINPDSKYNSVLIQKFINKIMQRGKKATAEIILYGALDVISKKTGKDPVVALEMAMRNVTPMMEVKSRRVGGSTYQIPIEVSRDRGLAMAMKWIVASAIDRGGRSMIEKLSNEIMDAINNAGGAAKKREDLHKTAEANKAFAHFRW